MADDTDPADDHDSAADVGHELVADRTTAPMSEYSTHDVVLGLVVLVIGTILAFGLPLLV